MKTQPKRLLAGAAALALLGAGSHAWADHAWANYHWSDSIQPLELQIGDNVTSAWDGYLTGAIADWNASSRLDLTRVTGGTNPKNCKPVSGRIEVCNSNYGFNGWLGIAQIWLSGGHITQGVTKLNDSYFGLAAYNTPAWRALVTCQEIGHDFGLGHQDEDFSTDDTTSCMDYTDAPAGNESPDDHDYEQLELIYNHTHTDVPVISGPGGGKGGGKGGGRNRFPDEQPGGDTPGEWGRAVSTDSRGRPDVFVQDLGAGRRKVTHVFWALETKRPAGDGDH